MTEEQEWPAPWFFTIPVCNELFIPAKPWWTRKRELITELIRIGGTVSVCKGHQLKIRLCAFAGTCESPIENGQETDKFPGTPTNLPTHVYHPAMDSTLWPAFTTVFHSSGTQLQFKLLTESYFWKWEAFYLGKNQLLNSPWMPFLLDHFLQV